MNSIVRKTVGIWQLSFLNFCIASIQVGFGPFLGIFLLSKGWDTSAIGIVMTFGGIAGMLMTAFAGILIDSTTRKRVYVAVAGVCVILASSAILASQNFLVVVSSQIATAIAGAIIDPAIIGITLGIVYQQGFNRQNGLNQAYNHAGNMVGAGLSGYLGIRYGLSGVFSLSIAFGVLSIIFVLLIPAASINDKVARGLPESKGNYEKISGISLLYKNRNILILAICLACFHLGNGAMLPLYGLAAAAQKVEDPSMFVAMTIVIAQSVMIIASITAMKLVENNRYYLVILISFIALPIRGLVASHFISHAGLYPVQILDGIGVGLQSVAVPALMARILNGTGRINVGQSAVMTVQGIGASLSPAIGGWMVKFIGYNNTFLLLGSFALVSIFLWCFFYKSLKSCYSLSTNSTTVIDKPVNLKSLKNELTED